MCHSAAALSVHNYRIRSFISRGTWRSLVVVTEQTVRPSAIVIRRRTTLLAAGAVASSSRLDSNYDSDVPFCVFVRHVCAFSLLSFRVQTAPCFVLLCWLFQSYFHFPVACSSCCLAGFADGSIVG